MIITDDLYTLDNEGNIILLKEVSNRNPLEIFFASVNEPIPGAYSLLTGAWVADKTDIREIYSDFWNKLLEAKTNSQIRVLTNIQYEAELASHNEVDAYVIDEVNGYVRLPLMKTLINSSGNVAGIDRAYPFIQVYNAPMNISAVKLDALANSKQNKLIAGDNIVINNDVISSTAQSKSDFNLSAEDPLNLQLVNWSNTSNVEIIASNLNFVYSFSITATTADFVTFKDGGYKTTNKFWNSYVDFPLKITEDAISILFANRQVFPILGIKNSKGDFSPVLMSNAGNDWDNCCRYLTGEFESNGETRNYFTDIQRPGYANGNNPNIVDMRAYSLMKNNSDIIFKTSTAVNAGDTTKYFAFNFGSNERIAKINCIRYLVSAPLNLFKVLKGDIWDGNKNPDQLLTIYDLNSAYKENVLNLKVSNIEGNSLKTVSDGLCLKVQGGSGIEVTSQNEGVLISNTLVSDITNINTSLNGIKFKDVTAAEYEALNPKDPKTLYIVVG